MDHNKEYIQLLMQLSLWKSAINDVAIQDNTSVKDRATLARVITEIEQYMKERRITMFR